MTTKILLLFLAIFTINVWAITIKEIPKNVTIQGENGGLAGNDAAWDSSTIKDKVYVMFYIDPDEKDTNEHFSKKLNEKKYDKTNYGNIAIVNLAATWKPNVVIENLLKSKQKEFPDTIYVKDKKSVLVKEWGLKDDASNILIFSKDSKLLFYKSGKISEDDIKKAFNIIEENL
ncbi:YtfJ family protein [Sulfurimonas sp.]|jgi:hypothetical protein|uniref:YtfJ family protein n=1 Tax=Sulfurimonas sp. TaxID=2022749 RepID=UPI0025E14C46|nr:YtfJ family protein [Sulfurimonas sp.]MCK9472907.1 YtfJ family protein [Sulfurimonas sp.]MDD3505813.1 YtfJ family protein [Sulfurimonas sp.]